MSKDMSNHTNFCCRYEKRLKQFIYESNLTYESLQRSISFVFELCCVLCIFYLKMENIGVTI